MPDLSGIEPSYKVTSTRKLQEDGSPTLLDIIDLRADVGQDYEVILDEWTAGGIKFKFDFSSPLAISSGGVASSISYNIKDGSYFQSTKSGLTLLDQKK